MKSANSEHLPVLFEYVYLYSCSYFSASIFLESGSKAFDEFLELIGMKVKMKGFTKFRAQLDNKSESATYGNILLSSLYLPQAINMLYAVVILIIIIIIIIIYAPMVRDPSPIPMLLIKISY